MRPDHPLTEAEGFAESVDPLEVPCSRAGCGAAEGRLCRHTGTLSHDERWQVAIALKLEGPEVDSADSELPETETVTVRGCRVSFAKRAAAPVPPPSIEAVLATIESMKADRPYTSASMALFQKVSLKAG